MQENSEVQLVRPSLFTWYMSVIIFFLVLGGIIWLYLAQAHNTGLIEDAQDAIIQIDRDIQTASADRQILIAQIIWSNAIRPSLDLKNIVAQFRIAAVEAGVGLQGFSIQDDTIATSLVATSPLSEAHPDPASTIIAMMRDYAKKQSYFSLEPILSITGDLTKRTTSIQLKVVPTNMQSASITPPVQ
jgi:hypothetical protein